VWGQQEVLQLALSRVVVFLQAWPGGLEDRVLIVDVLGHTTQTSALTNTHTRLSFCSGPGVCVGSVPQELDCNTLHSTTATRIHSTSSIQCVLQEQLVQQARNLFYSFDCSCYCCSGGRLH